MRKLLQLIGGQDACVPRTNSAEKLAGQERESRICRELGWESSTVAVL